MPTVRYRGKTRLSVFTYRFCMLEKMKKLLDLIRPHLIQFHQLAVFLYTLAEVFNRSNTASFSSRKLFQDNNLAEVVF